MFLTAFSDELTKLAQDDLEDPQILHEDLGGSEPKGSRLDPRNWKSKARWVLGYGSRAVQPKMQERIKRVRKQTKGFPGAQRARDKITGESGVKYFSAGDVSVSKQPGLYPAKGGFWQVSKGDGKKFKTKFIKSSPTGATAPKAQAKALPKPAPGTPAKKTLPVPLSKAETGAARYGGARRQGGRGALVRPSQPKVKRSRRRKLRQPPPAKTVAKQPTPKVSPAPQIRQRERSTFDMYDTSRMRKPVQGYGGYD